MEDIGSRWGIWRRAVVAAVLAMLAAFLGGQLLSPEGAGAQTQAGEITGCYKAKAKKKGKSKKAKRRAAKQKGILRIVPSGNCKRKEKRITWNVAGPRGSTGPQGPPGTEADVAIQLDALEQSLADALAQIEALTDQVATLEGLLAGVSNQDLLDTIAATETLCGENGVPALVDALNGVLGVDLIEAVLGEQTVDGIVCATGSP